MRQHIGGQDLERATPWPAAFHSLLSPSGVSGIHRLDRRPPRQWQRFAPLRLL